MMKFHINSFFVILFFCFYTACKEEDCCEKYELYPTVNKYVSFKVGDEMLYQIDSIKYDDFSGTVDTFRHWRKEVIIDKFYDLENRLVYKQEIYIREDSLSAWKKLKVRSVFVDEKYFELKEDNLIKIMLRYPVKVGYEWDSNLMNTLNEQNYSYRSLDAEEDLGWRYFNNLLLVNQIDEENLIEKRFSEEKYALNIGLISRRDLNIKTSFDGEVLSGYDCRWKLMRYSD